MQYEIVKPQSCPRKAIRNALYFIRDYIPEILFFATWEKAQKKCVKNVLFLTIGKSKNYFEYSRKM